ncbi:MAG: hypothetical protein JXP34_26970 [Planctomycetes bacterium]|nr:hypothetical protein [Planctomycetota bacterium]
MRGLYPYVLPALAYANLALGDYERATGAGRYARLHDHLSGLLFNAIRSAGGSPIHSYPAYSWNFDTIMALASLDVHDRNRKARRTPEVCEKHLAWIRDHGTHRPTGLPYSTGWDGSEDEPDPPRGCDLSMRICLLGRFDPEAAKELYRRYVAAHWVDLRIVAGFSEWPRGTQAPPDIDSGPIFAGIGMTATGIAVGTVRAMGDRGRQTRLAMHLASIEPMVRLAATGTSKEIRAAVAWFRARGIAIDPRYVTGFLYGDAALFYAVTVFPEDRDPPAAHPPPAPAGGPGT